LTHDRCWAAHTGAVVAQGEEVSDAWEAAREQVAEDFMEMLRTSPAAALAGLKRSGHGCRRILADLGVLGEMLVRQGYWAPEAAEHAVRLFGFDPAPECLGADDLPWQMVLYNLHCQPSTAETARQIAALAAPERRPAGLRGVDLAGIVPPAAECRQWLLRLVRAEAESVGLLEEAYRTGKDRAGYERVMERSRMLGEGETTRLYLRYSKEADSTFLRYFKELTATLKRDAEAAEDGDEAGSPDPVGSSAAPQPAGETVVTVTTPTADPVQGAEAGSRNEANDGATVTTAPTLSPWERLKVPLPSGVPEGRVRAAAPPGAEASEVPEGRVRASTPPNAPGAPPKTNTVLLALLVLLVGQLLGKEGRAVRAARLDEGPAGIRAEAFAPGGGVTARAEWRRGGFVGWALPTNSRKRWWAMPTLPL
jgi:hypothetical protein